MAAKKPVAKSAGQAKSRRATNAAVVPPQPQKVAPKKVMVVGPTGKRRMAREDEVNK